MSCPFIDRRYGQNFCDATDGYIMWDNYRNTCNSCDFNMCENFRRENTKPGKVQYLGSC